MDIFHGVEIRFRGERTTLGAGNADIVRRYGRLRFLHGEDRDAILRSLPNHDRAIVSEPFANKLRRPRGRPHRPAHRRREPSALTIAGIYYDYSSSQGLVIVDYSTLLQISAGPSRPPTPQSILRPAPSREAALREIRHRTSGLGVLIAPNAALRRASLEIFDRTFAITWALEAVAIVVAMLGAANALLAVVLDRRRELGMLRYLGASGPQVRAYDPDGGGVSRVCWRRPPGALLGFALSLLLIYVVNKQSFGWTIQFHPPGVLLGRGAAADLVRYGGGRPVSRPRRRPHQPFGGDPRRIAGTPVC